MTTHLFIPDNQVRPDVPLDHLGWIGEYIVEKKPNVIVNIGDFADLPSLSFWDAKTIKMEGRRIRKDIESVQEGMRLLTNPMKKYNNQRKRWKMKQYKPRMVITLGNHEERIVRAVEKHPELEGFLSLDSLNYEHYGWEVVPFKDVITIDGIAYSHFFYNPMTGRPYAGENALLRLKHIGHSFSMGHQQQHLTAQRALSNGTRQRALISGSCYLHFEDYKGAQANWHWRGIIMKHQVEDGNYDIMEVSLDFLCRKYEGIPLKEFMAKNYPEIKGVV